MNATLLTRASQVVPNNGVLINLVRLRVRQLTQGHRPLLELPPGMGTADIALSEIAAGKITSRPIEDDKASDVPPAAVIAFPAVVPKKKAA